MYGHTYSKSSMDQQGTVANPARGQLNRENAFFPVQNVFSPVRVTGTDCVVIMCNFINTRTRTYSRGKEGCPPKGSWGYCFQHAHFIPGTNCGCEEERRMLIGPWLPAKAAPVWNYLENYRPCAGGLSAVNAIGTQFCVVTR